MTEQRFIPRRCRPLSKERQQASAEPVQEVTLESLAKLTAFVLLAEPGMGKTRAFQKLAEITGGRCISASDIRALGITDEEARRPVYIDAVDEARAQGQNSILAELRKIIVDKKIQHFGIACRAADWKLSNQQDLETVASNQPCNAYHLLPFSLEDALQFETPSGLKLTHALEQQAEQQGLADMLGNPQSLQLLLEAADSQGGTLPDTRLAIYELACETLLREYNQRHHEAQSSQPWSSEDKLNAAGWLCALLLLSNSTAIADYKNRASREGLQLNDVMSARPPCVERDAVYAVLPTRLFKKPAGYEPLHRTLAEFLAARFLAKQVKEHQLLPTRVSALMLTPDGYVLSNLRGLTGWLAALSPQLSQTLMRADPEAVLEYGDLTLLNLFQKQWLIASLCHRPAVVRWNHSQTGHNYAPLASEDNRTYLAKGFARLNATTQAPTPNNTEAQEDTAIVLLLAIQHTPQNPKWEPTLLKCVRNEKLPIHLRSLAINALDTHAKNAPQIQRKILDALTADEIKDKDCELLGQLLMALYPAYVGPEEVMRYADLSKSRNINTYTMFWEYRLAEISQVEHLLPLMQAIAEALSEGKFKDLNRFDFVVPKCLGQLTVRAIERYGAEVSIERLAEWLSWCHGHRSKSVAAPLQVNDTIFSRRLITWQITNGEKLKAVVAWRVEFLEEHWLAHSICVPEAMSELTGKFWLDLAIHMLQKQYQEKAEYCVQRAYFCALENIETSRDLIESIHVVAEPYPDLKASLFQESLENNWKRENWLSEQRIFEQEKIKIAQENKNLNSLLSHLEDVANGATLQYLHMAAWVDSKHSGYLGYIQAEQTLTWRRQHPELQKATQRGYVACLKKLSDKVALAAISARAKKKLAYIELPALLGAKYLHQQDFDAFFRLDKETLQALVTIYFLNHINGTTWFIPLTEKYPEWVEEIWWQACQRAMTSTPSIQIPWLDELQSQAALRPLANRLFPKILEAWPAKFSESSLEIFRQVLSACLQLDAQDEIVKIIQKRLCLKSISATQKAYLLMAGFWMTPQKFSTQLETYLNSSQSLRENILGFVEKLENSRLVQPKNCLPQHAALLVRLFSPFCSPNSSADIYSEFPYEIVVGRSLINLLIAQLSNNLSDTDADEAQKQLVQLGQEHNLQAWHAPLARAAIAHKQRLSEHRFSQLSPQSVAKTLEQKEPANHADLMAITLDHLEDLQAKLRNSPDQLINQFWTVNRETHKPEPPAMNENEARNRIVNWLRPTLEKLGISLDPETLFGGGTRSDFSLSVAQMGKERMRLPIEVKGDWHRDLWNAAYKQLWGQYASAPECDGYGIYLVLYLGNRRDDRQKIKHPANRRITSLATLQDELEKNLRSKPEMKHLRVVVLDLSTP